jgi:hypothetical protein
VLVALSSPGDWRLALGRRVLASLLPVVVAGAAARGQDAGAIAWSAIAAGVEHAHVVRQAAPGPWNIHLLRIDLSQVRLDAVRALDEAVGLETVSSLAARHAAIAAVNGGYFRTTGTFRGDSAGTLQIDGTLLSEPDRGRAAVGFVRGEGSSRLVFGHLTWEAAVEASGERRALNGLNRPRGANELILFTPPFHRTTLTDPSGLEAVVRAGRVGEVRDGAGSTVIPADGFVLSAAGAAREWARERLAPGAEVRVSMAVKPVDPGAPNVWAEAEDIVGAGPKLVTAGKADVTVEREEMQRAFATDRHPRTAIAALADRRVLLVVVDGRHPGVSIGMTLGELAALLIDLGATEAINLDGGGSTTMVVKGKVMNQPSDASGERPVSDAILVRPRGT